MTFTTSGRSRWVPLLLVVLVAVAGCTGIPTTSRPQVVRTIDRGGNAEAAEPNITPSPGADPRAIVNDFILAGVAADAGHSSSRQFLTNAAARKWQDNTVTVVNSTTVNFPQYSGAHATVTVVGSRVGQVDATGAFTPILKGSGSGDPETFSFGLVRTDGQWRIDQLQPGVLISDLAFGNAYRPRKLFFFNADESSLVPDLRYSALTGQSLANWLLAELLAGPAPELAQSVVNEVPDQVGKPIVQVGDPIAVDMPGVNQLDAAGKNGLAAQLAYTLSQVQFAPAQLRLTDAGRPVTVPAAGGATFGAIDFNSVAPDSVAPGVEPYFIRSGAVISGVDGTPLTGPLGRSSARLSSVALRRTDSGIDVAAVSDGALEMGDTGKLTSVPKLPSGALSRPEWRPHADDVWVGVGTHGAIYRVGTDRVPRPVSITSPVGLLPAQVQAIRFSADGTRVAAVLRFPGGSESAWVGSVVTSGGDVRLVGFELVTPADLTVTDVAWADSTKLQMIAKETGTATTVWQVQSDGSHLESLTNTGLSGAPTSIAASPTRLPLVSAGGAIWTQRGSAWSYFPGPSATMGTNPIYVS